MKEALTILTAALLLLVLAPVTAASASSISVAAKPVGFLYRWDAQSLGGLRAVGVGGERFVYLREDTGRVLLVFPRVESLLFERGDVRVRGYDIVGGPAPVLVVVEGENRGVIVKSAPLQLAVLGERVYRFSGTPANNGSVAILHNSVIESRVRDTQLAIITSDTVTLVNFTRLHDEHASIASILGVSGDCVHRATDSQYYAYYITNAPQCTRTLKPLKTEVFGGEEGVVLAEVNVNGNHVIISFARTETRALEDAGIARILRGGYTVMNTILVEPRPSAVYTVENGALGEKLRELTARNATLARGDKRICYVTGSITLNMTWEPVERGERALLPGDIIVFEEGGERYVCTGRLDYTVEKPLVTVAGALFEEYIVDRGLLLRSDGTPIVNKTRVTRDDYKHHTYFVAGAGTIYLLTKPRITGTGKAFIALTLASLVVAVAVAALRALREYGTVTVLIDVDRILQEREHRVAGRSELTAAAKRHIAARGYCPTLIELVRDHQVLPPIAGRRSVDEVWCHFDTSTEVEERVKRFIELFLSLFWSVRRDPETGRIGHVARLVYGYLLVYYFFVVRGEGTLREVVENFVRHLRDYRISATAKLDVRGVIFIVDPERRRRFLEELRSIAGGSVASATLSSLASAYGVEVSGSLRGVLDKMRVYLYDGSEQSVRFLLGRIARDVQELLRGFEK